MPGRGALPSRSPNWLSTNEGLVAGAAKVAIVRRAFLLAVGWTGAAVHVEDDRPRRSPVVHPVDPGAAEVAQRRRVLVGGQKLGLEPPHLAGGRRPPVDGVAADDAAHGGIARQAISVVHRRRSHQGDRRRTGGTIPSCQCRPSLPVRLSMSTSPAGPVNPRTSSSSRYGSKPPSEVIRRHGIRP